MHQERQMCPGERKGSFSRRNIIERAGGGGACCVWVQGMQGAVGWRRHRKLYLAERWHPAGGPFTAPSGST